MTYQTDQIQSMISEVDRVLRQTRSRKFWTIFTNHTLQRQALERCRNFLVMQQRPTSQALAPGSMQLIPTSNRASADSNLALELQRLRQEVMHPLRSDVAALGNQRTALQEEIQTLMFQKAQLQSDCETVRLNLAQNLSPVSPQKATNALQSSLDESELARFQALRDRTNFLLTSMDSSLQLAFGSMQKNVEVYQTTLHTGLDRMHHLGYQGEVLFSTLVNRLAQQVGRDMAIALPEPSSTIETRDDWSIKQSSRIDPIEPPTSRVPDSPMNESIDFFFADFDQTLSVQSHSSDQSSSPNLRPQQVDSITASPSFGIEPSEDSNNRSDDGDSLTIDSLFGFLEDGPETFVESEMTLAEMDDLFADVPAL